MYGYECYFSDDLNGVPENSIIYHQGNLYLLMNGTWFKGLTPECYYLRDIRCGKLYKYQHKCGLKRIRDCDDFRCLKLQVCLCPARPMPEEFGPKGDITLGQLFTTVKPLFGKLFAKDCAACQGFYD